jgi:hypothetical protein
LAASLFSNHAWRTTPPSAAALLRRIASAMRDVQAQSGEADNSINLPQQIAGNIFEKLRAVTFTSKVKTRVKLRCEAEAVWLLNVLVISQR